MKGYSLYKNEAMVVFQRIKMDFGLVQYKSADGNGNLLRIRLGFGANILIADEYNR